MDKLQLTFAILKPHIIKHPVSFKQIQNIILQSNFKIVRSKICKINDEQAADFYYEHRNKFFYNRLHTFMTSGPSALYILARENAIKEWRSLMGPTKVYKAQFEAPASIRGLYGLSDTRNATHGSDSPESVEREIAVFFPEFNIQQWLINDGEYFRDGRVVFVEEKFVHLPKYDVS